MGVACECGLVGPSGSMNSPFHREKGCHITRISWCHVGKVKEYGAKKRALIAPLVGKISSLRWWIEVFLDELQNLLRIDAFGAVERDLLPSNLQVGQLATFREELNGHRRRRRQITALPHRALDPSNCGFLGELSIEDELRSLDNQVLVPFVCQCRQIGHMLSADECRIVFKQCESCLLYTSDAADE